MVLFGSKSRQDKRGIDFIGAFDIYFKDAPTIKKIRSNRLRKKIAKEIKKGKLIKSLRLGGSIMRGKGLPSRFAKMGFKRGWAAFKAGRLPHHGAKRKAKRHFSPLRFGDDMSAPAIVRAPIRRMSSITPSKILSPVIDLALIIAGMAVATTLKKISPIKNAHLMNGGQIILGVGGSLMTKNRFVKMPLLGIALQSAIAETKTFFPTVPLAGDDEVVYLPAGDDEPRQIVYQGEDRIGDELEGDDRIGEAIGDEEMAEAIGGNGMSEGL